MLAKKAQFWFPSEHHRRIAPLVHTATLQNHIALSSPAVMATFSSKPFAHLTLSSEPHWSFTVIYSLSLKRSFSIPTALLKGVQPSTSFSFWYFAFKIILWPSISVQLRLISSLTPVSGMNLSAATMELIGSLLLWVSSPGRLYSQ